MASYKIEFSNSIEKDFSKLDKNISKKVWSKIDELADNPLPLNNKKLSGTNFHRIRIGDYRVIYEINSKSKTITILRAKHRKEVYRDL